MCCGSTAATPTCDMHTSYPRSPPIKASTSSMHLWLHTHNNKLSKLNTHSKPTTSAGALALPNWGLRSNNNIGCVCRLCNKLPARETQRMVATYSVTRKQRHAIGRGPRQNTVQRETDLKSSCPAHTRTMRTQAGAHAHGTMLKNSCLQIKCAVDSGPATPAMCATIPHTQCMHNRHPDMP